MNPLCGSLGVARERGEVVRFQASHYPGPSPPAGRRGSPAPALFSSSSPSSGGRAQDVALLQGLDKITARVSKFDAPMNAAVHFGSLVITVKACVKPPPEEPPNTAAFLDIDKIRGNGTTVESKRVFSGWMFALSPAVSALEDPIYDVGVLDCKIADTAKPSSGSTGK